MYILLNERNIGKRVMMVWSINILVLAVGFFILGMIKPKWLLFWMDKPSRMPVFLLSVILFMVSAVMFGEANKEKQQEQKIVTVSPANENSVPTIAVEPKI